MSSLMESVRAGRTPEVVSLLDEMTDTERRSLLPELTALRKELRAAPWEAPARRAYSPLFAAGVACQTGAAAVAAWIAAADLRWSQTSPALLLRILGDRSPEWLADLTHRLAERPASSDVPYELMSGLVRLSGCPVPTTDAYVRGWMGHLGWAWRQGGTLLDRLRPDPHLAELVAALFETSDIGGLLEWPHGDGPDTWTGALAQLTTEGVLDRKVMVDACVSRLLRGGTKTELRVFLRLLKMLDLGRDEERERTPDWLALASDAVSPVASHAQSVLAALVLDGELTAHQLAELSGAVLFRTEKKLVRAQLVLLGKALTRDASTADELLSAVAQAFGHQDSDVQERALKLVERHLKKVGSAELRGELAVAAEQLIPALRARAGQLLGTAPATPGPLAYEEVLPPVPQPARLAPAPASAVEVAEEVGSALAAEPGVAGFERALAGLVCHAYRDREALLEALEPVLIRRWWYDADSPDGPHHTGRFDRSDFAVSDAEDGLDLFLAALSGRVNTDTLHGFVQHEPTVRGCRHSALSRAFAARLREVAHRLRTDPLPFLLSTPTWSTGLLEPDELVDRLDEYRRLGARVSAADFAQALLRTRRTDRAAAARAAERAAALGTAEGARLADWLGDPGSALPTTRRRISGGRILLECGELLELQGDFPPEFRPLGRPMSVVERGYCHHWNDDIRPHWLALLPERRELVAGRLLRDLSAGAMDDERGAAAVLPLLAESGGEAGEATHLGLAYGLGARHAEDRLAAVDALLILAARGQLDAARLGADLGELVRHGAVKPLRLAESARTAAATGANATVWEMLRHTLPALLAEPAAGGGNGNGQGMSARGLGDLLAVAAECAERSGARGEIPHLAQTAERSGSSRLVSQARRLRGALAIQS
ncbi:DUF6493 family protein [Streptomyces sp. CA-249302]|uniref:DUF7824 domain-containing protein n=1 Tax=Streptomyces sp. CA-249302 TaxID=3240058 RepID=UPI003D9421AF